LQRTDESHQGSQDTNEETGQGQTGRGQDEIHQKSHCGIQKIKRIASEQKEPSPAEEQDHPTKEINLQDQRLNPVIWYDLVHHGLTYTGYNIKYDYDH